MSTSKPDKLLHNRYIIRRKLGQGGMGEVYLAEDTTLPGRLVALKENSLPDRKTQDQFQHEALLLAHLQHPNLPRVSDYFRTDDGRQFLVMDYIRGDNLQERLRSTRQPMSEDEVRTCARQMLSALNYLHNWRDPDTGVARPVIHRDIKPANIKQMPDGRYMLLDFGISKASMDEATALSARALTPGYAPIEQYDGGTDARSDIYSLGATLYALLAGKNPPSATGLAAGSLLHPVREYNRQVSRRLAEVIERAMAVRAEDRYQSAAEMYAALFDEALPDAHPQAAAAPFAGNAHAATISHTNTRLGTTLRSLRRNRRFSIPALLLTVALIWIAGAMFWLLLSDPGTPIESTETVGGGPPPTGISSTSDSQPSTPETDNPQMDQEVVDAGTSVVLAPVVDASGTPSVTPSVTPSATPSATASATETATQQPDLTATAAAEEARILAILATRDAKATADAPTVTHTPTPTALPTDTNTPEPTATSDRAATAQVQATRTAIAKATQRANAATNTPTYTLTFTPTPKPTLSLRTQIEQVLRRWDELHHEVDRTLDPTDLPLVLTGEALAQQQQALQWLSDNNCYWEFQDLAPAEVRGLEQVSSNEVVVDARKHWDGDHYCDGEYVARSSFEDPFFVRYTLVRTDRWRVADKESIEEDEVMSSDGTRPSATHTPTPFVADQQLIDDLLAKSRSSAVALNHRDPAADYADALVGRLGQFRGSSSGVSAQAMGDALRRGDAGDRLNSLVQDVWGEWHEWAQQGGFNAYTTDPGSMDLSPFRQLTIRLIQDRQGALTDAQQHALYNYFTRSESSDVWYNNADGVIGAINRESFHWP